MKKRLLLQALTKLIVAQLIIGILLFLPAGTLSYWQAWLFFDILFAPMILAGAWLFVRRPELLKKRLNAKEKESEQKTVVRYSGLLFIAVFVLAGLNYRFKWLLLPDWTTYVASAFFVIGYIIYLEVMRENTWLSRTVEVQDQQQVISSGLYGIVRHPMYASTLVMFLSMPIVLNSIWSFIIMLLYIPIINKRIRHEEKVLENELTGYIEYEQRVRYRVIPRIW